MSQPATPLRFALLGPLEVRRDGARIDPETPKLRTLLVDLLVHRGVPRSTDRLIDDLWADTPPATDRQRLAELRLAAAQAARQRRRATRRNRLRH